MKRLALLLLFGASVWGQTTTTTVIGTVTNPSGTGLNGKVYITWSRFTAAGGEIIPAPTRPLEVTVTNGTFSVELIPNDTAVPAGGGYTVWYSFYPGQTETWTVPTSAGDVNASDIATTDIVDATYTVALTQLTRSGATTGQCLIWTSGYWQAATCPGSGTWGAITGTLSAQTDLQNALNAKAATSHAHAGTDVTSGTVAVARLPAMVGDSGAGGTAGLAPAPGAGDAAAGKALSAGGTWTVFNPTTTRGDIVYRGASGLSRLPLGTFAQCLLSNGTDPQWTTCPSGFADPMTTRGDLIYRGAAGSTRLPLGTNGYCLRSNGVDAEWGTCTAYTDPMTTLGDILYRGASTTSRLAGNTTTTRKFLRQTGTGSASAAPAWDVLTSSDLPAPGVGSKGGVESKTCSGTDKLSAIGTDGVPVCAAVTAAAPYTTTISAQTSVSILASTHLQGATAVGFCFDDATPRQVVACTYTRASNGDFVFSFSPAFTGLLQVGGAGGGGGGGDGLGTSVAADIVALFSTCTGTKYLGADGACHDDATGGTYVAGPSGAIVINTVPNPDTVDVDTAVVPLLAQANVWTGLQDFTTAANILIKEGTPATASTACTKGTILYDASFIYVCIATDTYKKVAIATW